MMETEGISFQRSSIILNTDHHHLKEPSSLEHHDVCLYVCLMYINGLFFPHIFIDEGHFPPIFD